MSEGIIGWGEVCRNHGIANPEDLDSALADYEALAEQHKIIVERYAKEALPNKLPNGDYVCPLCERRVREWWPHCNHCGKKLGWNGLLDPNNRRFRYGKKQAKKEHRNKCV